MNKVNWIWKMNICKKKKNETTFHNISLSDDNISLKVTYLCIDNIESRLARKLHILSRNFQLAVDVLIFNFFLPPYLTYAK